MSDQSNHGAPFFAVENGSYGTYDPRMPQRKVRIKIEHRIEYPDPLRVAAGERVNVGHEDRSEEHTSELQSPCNLVCRLLLEKKKNNIILTDYVSYRSGSCEGH